MKKPKKKWKCSDGTLFDKKGHAKTYEKFLKNLKKSDKRRL